MIEKNKIIEKIYSAFGNNWYPGDDFLLGSMDGSEPIQEIKPFIGQTDWKKIAPPVLDSHSGALNFFSEAGFRFFLPAFLVADLNDQLQTADPLFSLVHGFSSLSVPHKIGDQAFVRKVGGDAFINPKRYGALTFNDYARYRLSIFTREETVAIVGYLEYRRENDPDGLDRDQIDAALNSFWYERAKSAPDDRSIEEHLRAEDEYLDALSRE